MLVRARVQTHGFGMIAQVRLGWHDAGTYNKNIEEWPRRGGANGSVRFDKELKHAANAGTSSLPCSFVIYCWDQGFSDNKWDHRPSKCFKASSACQGQVFRCYICRFVPISQCYSC